MEVTVFRVCNTPLAISEVVSLLKNPPGDVLSTLPPAMPKAGEIYLYRNNSETHNGMIYNFLSYMNINYVHVIRLVDMLLEWSFVVI